MRNEGGYMRNVDELNLTPVSNLHMEPIAFLLKVGKLLIRLSSFNLGSLAAKKISKEKVRQP